MFAVGTVIEGKYRIDRVLGQGGMGMVVAATHLALGQRVALKFLLAEYTSNPVIVERFVREARASAGLRGEHVCRVSDVGALESGMPYIVMELLEGGDLASLLASRGPLPVATACDFVLQACVGVAEAHAASIVHRDLKPANLFATVRPDGTPLIKVLDFGIAKAQGDTGFNITRTASVLGSPGYMSPEQFRSSKDVDVRSDVWSLGVILFELVSGAPPFKAESITELAIRVTMDPTPPLVGRMPHGFDEVVNRCLAKDPAQRYPDLANLSHALAAYAGSGGWELANAVSRMLGPQARGGGPVALVPPPAAPPERWPAPGPGGAIPPAHGAPTTMGAAASAVMPGRSGRGARWGIVAGMAIVAVAAAIGLAVTRGGSGGAAPQVAPQDPAPAAQPSGPAVAAEPPDRSGTAAPPPGTTPGDAAAPAAEPDAAVAAVAAEPPPAAGAKAAGKPLARPEKPVKPPGKPPVKPAAEDLGESRF